MTIWEYGSFTARKPVLSENYSFLIFSNQKGRNRQCKIVFLLELVVIINESCYNHGGYF